MEWYPPPGDLPGPGAESTSLTSLVLASVFFTTTAIRVRPQLEEAWPATVYEVTRVGHDWTSEHACYWRELGQITSLLEAPVFLSPGRKLLHTPRPQPRKSLQRPQKPAFIGVPFLHQIYPGLSLTLTFWPWSPQTKPPAWEAHIWILLSLKKEWNSDSCYTWTNLENIMLSEINQPKKTNALCLCHVKTKPLHEVPEVVKFTETE